MTVRASIQLAEPSAARREAYLEMVEDFAAVGETRRRLPHGVVPAVVDFELYLRRRERMAAGFDLRPGEVPNSDYWLIDGERMIGTGNLRHELGERHLNEVGHIGYCIRPSERRKGYATMFLALLLERARQMGIDRALLVCPEKFTASARVIEKNGGVLEDRRISSRRGHCLRRYWIELA